MFNDSYASKEIWSIVLDDLFGCSLWGNTVWDIFDVSRQHFIDNLAYTLSWQMLYKKKIANKVFFEYQIFKYFPYDGFRIPKYI